MLPFVRRIFRRRSEPFNWALKAPELTIIPAFTADGVQYYTIPNTEELPALRAFEALMIYEAFQMRTTREYLVLLYDGILNAVDNGELGLIARYVADAKDRLNWIIEPETVYQLASVLYFDEHESPYRYDPVYNRQKIARWKALPQTDFFLQLPLKDWIPYADISASILARYSAAATLLTHEQIARLSFRSKHTPEPSSSGFSNPVTSPRSNSATAS